MRVILSIAALGLSACQHTPVAATQTGDADTATANVAVDASIASSDASIAIADAGSSEAPDAAATSLAVPTGMFGFAPCSGPAAEAYARLHRGRENTVNERTTPLGSHYSKRSFSVRSGGFEAVAHYDELHCGAIILSTPVGFVSVSPDENFVVYEDTEGHNLVHGFVSGNIRSATPKPYALPLDVKWDLAHKQVTVRYPAPTKPITVALP